MIKRWISSLHTYPRAFSVISCKERTYIFMAAFLFYFGDLATTFVALNSGEKYEANILLAQAGFLGTVILKTLFAIVFLIFFTQLKQAKKDMECGMLIGAVIAIGAFTVLNNVGFFGGI